MGNAKVEVQGPEGSGNKSKREKKVAEPRWEHRGGEKWLESGNLVEVCCGKWREEGCRVKGWGTGLGRRRLALTPMVEKQVKHEPPVPSQG